jgi:hypothetical protein
MRIELKNGALMSPSCFPSCRRSSRSVLTLVFGGIMFMMLGKDPARSALQPSSSSR